MSEISRRDFMKGAALTLGAGATLPSFSRGQVPGANDKVVVGVIGAGRMGQSNMEAFLKFPEVEVAAVCDVYQPNLDKTMAAAQGKAQPYKDFRQVLDRKDIDVVIIATPDHWHALQTVMACQAGKDIYVEKPIAVCVEEGKRMVEAVRRYKRVVQVGTWQRSGVHFQKAVQLVQQGYLGKINFVCTWNYGNESPEGIGNPPDTDPPATLDWDMWLGPAPKVPFNANRFGVGDRWSTFRYFWDYAGGLMTDWGVHLLDIVQWALKQEGPRSAAAMGGKFCLQDNRETPDTLQVTYEFPGVIATYENRAANGNSLFGKGYGITFHGTDGTMFLDRDGFRVYPEKTMLGKKEVERAPAVQMSEANQSLVDHVRDFLECVKSRKQPISDIEIGHRSTSICLLGNIALRCQERIAWDVAGEKLVNSSDQAKKMLSREYRKPWKLEV